MPTKLVFETEEEKSKYYKKVFQKKIDEDDWQYLKNRYVAGINKNGTIYFPDKSEVLREWNENNPEKQISEDYFYKQTLKRDWNKNRTLVKRKVEGKKNLDELRAVISQSADLESEALTAIKNLYKLINTSIVQKYGSLLDNTLDSNDEELPRVDSQEILQLVNCIPKLIKSTKDVLGNEEDINIIEEMRLIEEEQNKEQETQTLAELEKELRDLSNSFKYKVKE